MAESLHFIVIVVQIILFTYTISCCSKETNLKKYLFMIIFLFVINFIAVGARKYLSVINILLHLLTIVSIYLCYSEDYKERIINSSFFYIFNSIMSIILINVSKFSSTIISSSEYINLLIENLKFILYMFLSIIYILNIQSLCKSYLNKKYCYEIVIYSFIVEFIFAPLNGVYLCDGNFIIEFIIIIEQIFILAVALYFYKVYRKSYNIFQLNKELEVKNSELKNIKNKNLDIVNYLRQLYTRNKKEEIGVLLKEIINGKENIVKEKIEYNMDEDSLIGMCVRNARKNEINIDLKESYDISFCDINHLDLYRIITNILNNAIRALEGRKEKKINIRTYKSGKNAVIEIDNNGPMIKEEDIRNIFKKGFTTKDNNDSSHGYGLSIVKELIESRNGKIEVRSTEVLTMFKIVLPIKKTSNF